VSYRTGLFGFVVYVGSWLWCFFIDGGCLLQCGLVNALIA
jgi:hypothetical protein